jgi:hypothetical protein
VFSCFSSCCPSSFSYLSCHHLLSILHLLLFPLLPLLLFPIYPASSVLSCPSTHSKYKQFPLYRGADKSLTQPGRKQTTATEDFNVHISYL